MKKFSRLVVLIAIACLVGGSVAVADGVETPMREFTGRIDKIKKKKLIVDNRMGDKVSFVKVDETEVKGEKENWKKLKKGDWVTVSWKFIDKPRKAYVVRVIPEKEEAGKDL